MLEKCDIRVKKRQIKRKYKYYKYEQRKSNFSTEKSGKIIYETELILELMSRILDTIAGSAFRTSSIFRIEERTVA